MLKLMKYELRKTAFSKLVLLVITAVAEIAFLIGVFWKKDNILAMGIIFLVMCTIFGVIYIGIESVNVLQVKCRARVPFVTQESLFVNENLIL